MQDFMFIYFVVLIAFVFDFVNGFHDAANSIATIVATGALKPLTAVFWAAFFNFIAFLFFHLNVANTFGVGLVNPQNLTPYVIFSALSGAIIFNVITWYFALPSSSSHALIGGLMGAVLAKAGWHSLEINGLSKTFFAIIASPVLGMILSIGLLWLLKKYLSTSKIKFHKNVQLISAALLSLGHGGNDAQKTMGIIAALLFSSGLLGGHFYIPFWVMIACNLVIALGTFAGGWRIVKTLGEKITCLDAQSGAASETGTALVLFLATYLGIPVSTTHIVTGAIVGVGVNNNWRLTNWGVMKNIAFTWLLTIPCAALIAALFVGIQKI